MNVPPPGPLVDEAAKFAEALLGRVRGAAGPELPPELRERLAAAVVDVAVAGAGLLRVVADVAAAWGDAAGADRPADRPAPEAEPTGPRVERIDIG
jgi:hypothetical protein